MTLQDDFPKAVDFMMTYFYNQDYGNESTTLMDHVQVYLITDKYEAPDLKALAVSKFEGDSFHPAVDTPTLLAAARVIYDNTTQAHQDIRSVGIEAWLRKAEGKQISYKTSSIREDLCAIPEFAVDLLTYYATARRTGQHTLTVSKFTW